MVSRDLVPMTTGSPGHDVQSEPLPLAVDGATGTTEAMRVGQPCSSSGGSLAVSAALLHASAISHLIYITTASMLRLTTMSRLQRAAMPDRCVSVMPAIWSTSSL